MTWPTLRSLAPTLVLVVTLLAGLGVAVARGDVVGAVLTVLVVGLTGVVQSFSRRHLRGDPRAGRFLAYSTAFAGASVVAVTASTLVVLAAGWSAASVFMALLLATGGAPQTAVAVRRAGVAFVVGDLALWGAVALTVASLGTTGFADLADLGPVAAAAVGALIAVAAVARAASVPFHGWLSATVASTTPVSALLHAGFVNAGALLLLRTDAVPSFAGPLVVGVSGALTVVIAGAAMLTRSDVKGRLVQSTAAQMGFMLVACSLGAFAVALVHVVGHALFKASLFLGAGSAMERAVSGRAAPRTDRDPRMPLLAALAVIAVAVAAVIGTAAWTSPSAVLLLFVVTTAAVAAAQLAGGALSSAARLAGVALVGGAVVTYVFAVGGLGGLLGLPPAAAAMPPALAVATFAAGLAVAFLAQTRGALADRAYVFALGWGRPPLPVSSSVPAGSSGPREYRSAS
ncbi:NADH:ubiquinone oxidoreductase subunit 5 (subunit L)/multisubunit Na+/H+ antiporter MnhA subunit [Microbacterium sp. AK009]|uniref:proton-conducting transporter transmembrane domain-containing protein n=1 Tax=Microbacterium sp. AK009 TaxID=2723068 RepID=UPI0015CC89DC|nr:proton-conducting transporter membrane subunit [Microbacterium sp. AK009]NYF16942.1 NADH:ubiquinone oxidoreductase subunit 5 (subunit L)/multisubunit Na+/H+ antiporter MnhA subunit [Microbacterium sp. AK009]